MTGIKRFVALTSPDARGRFNLKRWIAPGVDEWTVSRSPDGKTITLEAREYEEES